MSTFTKSLLCAGIVVFSFAGAASAEWISITVANPSFESPDRSDGQGAFTSEWGEWGSGTARVYDPTSPVFSGTDGDNTQGVLPDGGQIAVLHVPEAGQYDIDYRLLQTTDHEIVAGETYKLSFYYGARTEHTNRFASVTASLLDENSNVVGSLLIDTAPAYGTFLSATFEATADVAHSGSLKIAFVGGEYAGSTYYGQEFIDMVSLSYQPIPEPNAFALLATGLVGLLCYAWRKRK